jgi:hypothetical protein
MKDRSPPSETEVANTLSNLFGHLISIRQSTPQADGSWPEEVFLVVYTLDTEMSMGGFYLYLSNDSGTSAPTAARALLQIGALESAAIVERAIHLIFHGAPPPTDPQTCHDMVQDFADEEGDRLCELDDTFFEEGEPLMRLLYSYVVANHHAIRGSSQVWPGLNQT